MKEIIHKLRSKPEHYRRGVALGVSAGVTLLLGGAWLITLPVRLNAISQTSKGTQPAAVSATPLEALQTSLNQGISSSKSNSSAAPADTQDSQQSYVSNGVVITDQN
jgi:hypothetical protein